MASVSRISESAYNCGFYSWPQNYFIQRYLNTHAWFTPWKMKALSYFETSGTDNVATEGPAWAKQIPSAVLISICKASSQATHAIIA